MLLVPGSLGVESYGGQERLPGSPGEKTAPRVQLLLIVLCLMSSSLELVLSVELETFQLLCRDGLEYPPPPSFWMILKIVGMGSTLHTLNRSRCGFVECLNSSCVFSSFKV